MGSKVLVEKGCKALNITKGATAVVKAIEPLGAEYSHACRVTLYFLSSFMSGKTIMLCARHPNRMADPLVRLSHLDPTRFVEIRLK